MQLSCIKLYIGNHQESYIDQDIAHGGTSITGQK